MSEKDTPAFPQFDYGNRGAGMSLRDYFAGQALVGVMGNSNLLAAASLKSDPKKSLALMAFEQADAMLRARKGSQ